MPKKSTKSKSKRTTLRQKYKVLRKVKEHHRKKRKEMNKKGIKPKEPKDPGIPNAWPFKEELVEQLRAQRDREVLREKMKREERRRLQVQQAEDGMDLDGGNELQALQAKAAQQLYQFQSDADRTPADKAAAFVDSSRRAFYKEFVKVVEASDVILEVLDARDPLGCRCLDVERFVRQAGPNKKVVLLLNKIDLVPREVAEAWLAYLREEVPAVAFKCSTQKQATNLGRRPMGQSTGGTFQGSDCLGADTLLQLLKNYSRNAGLKTSITVGIIGLPNVGKSSVINSLKRARVAQVGNAPGVTRSMQQVQLDKQVMLLDSPGVVFAEAAADGAAAAALRNCVKVDQLPDPMLPVGEIVRRCPAKQLMALYKAPAFADADGLLVHVALSRGKLKKGGTADLQAAARMVVQDWNDGRIPYYTLPPKRNSEVAGSTGLVETWGKEFNADEVFQRESRLVIAGLPSMDAASTDFFQTETLGAADVDLQGMQTEADAPAAELQDSGEEGSPLGSDMDEGETKPAARQLRSRSEQNAKLYSQPGQFNPHAAREERKRRKRAAKDPAPAGDDSDFDFDAE